MTGVNPAQIVSQIQDVESVPIAKHVVVLQDCLVKSQITWPYGCSLRACILVIVDESCPA